MLQNGLITKILTHMPKNAGQEKSHKLKQFIQAYYARLHSDELDEVSSEDLFGAALCHWQLAQIREPEKASVRVYNPKIQKDNWQSSHTVIDIVTDDMPFLVMSLSMSIAAQGLNIHQTVHPVLLIRRDENGEIDHIEDTFASPDQAKKKSKPNEKPRSESLMHIEIDHLSSEAELTELRTKVFSVLNSIACVNRDQNAMLAIMEQLKQLLDEKDNKGESAALLSWLDKRHFAILGLAELELGEQGAQVVADTQALGLFNGCEVNITPQHLLPSNTTPLFSSSELISVAKTSTPSPMVRPENLDVVVVLKAGATAAQNRLFCVTGLFASFVKHLDTSQIPMLRKKTLQIQKNAGLDIDSHAGKALTGTLEQLPRDMLFQHDPETLLEIALGIVSLQERQRIRVFGSISPNKMHCNCLVYIPREHYGRELRLAIERILLEELNGLSSEFDSQFSSESVLARIHYTIRRPVLSKAEPDWATIEEKVIEAAITWEDRLLDTLLHNFDESTALKLQRTYREAFPVAYKQSYSARLAQTDIAFIEDELQTDRPMMRFLNDQLADRDTLKFKLYSPYQNVSLSDVIPVIENMGLRVNAEHPFEIRRDGADKLWIHEFIVKRMDGRELSDSVPYSNLQTVFEKIWLQEVENDGFNQLILDPGLNWRQGVLLRSYCKYLLQIGVPFSQAYMIDTLVKNSAITEQLVSLFEARFNPQLQEQSEQLQTRHTDNIKEHLVAVVSLDEDRILRSFLNLIAATLRTNFYCSDENQQPLPYVSFKFDCKQIKGLPLPHPHVEIFVYSPRVEGIHLRGGKVARGGLRWSDRREDFRVEVLGLMKAQMVKNAVIVPVGSKGGFYVKRPPVSNDREVQIAEGVECYQTFLRGLLDVTDNIDGDKLIAPPNVVRYDQDDPYLVVAADKGTATFSDHANAVAIEYGFWLGDAFASGGSVGYDHKKMGITARGAWESVKRHFRELNRDIQKTPFTAAGIGDMAGDVFGNGMLLSEHTQLVAAFNHMHIFIDPTPDAASSYAERKRLFDLPRSSWSDYNESLLSAGGRIYPRSLKEIELTPQAMQALDINSKTLTPNELISAILRAPLDLLWNGGIGTYIKASTERHAEAADRSNDSLRVNANELRCKVLGEGGNLGVTQLARIEFAKRGGLVYTDAIDNSAGVDCSDHEVNIKILLNSIVQAGDMTVKQRDVLLAGMTDEVGELVLLDNYLQTQCINVAHFESAQSLEEHARFIAAREFAGLLDREIEFLPNKDDIADRLANNQGLTRPELAVIVAYSKMGLYEELLGSELTQDTGLNTLLQSYFPEPLRQSFSKEIQQHRLRAEIIATSVTNQLVNRLGPTFAFRMQEELGSTPAQIAKAFVATVEIFAMHDTWRQIEILDNVVSADIQTSMRILVRGLVERAVHWILRSRRDHDSINALVSYFKDGVSDLIESMPACLASTNRRTLDERCAFFTNAGAPEQTALSVAQVVPMSSALDIVEISKTCERTVADSAAVYFELGVHLNLQWLRDEISQLSVRSHWHTLAKSELRSEIHSQQSHLCADVLRRSASSKGAADQVLEWAESNPKGIQKYNALINEMKAASGIDFAMLSLAVNEVHKLLRADGIPKL